MTEQDVTPASGNLAKAERMLRDFEEHPHNRQVLERGPKHPRYKYLGPRHEELKRQVEALRPIEPEGEGAPEAEDLRDAAA
jgi:hypothetical protein